MHPIFGSDKHFKAVLLFWLFISVLAGLLVTEVMQPHLHEQALIESCALIIPWYFVLIFFCFSNYYLCQWIPIGKTKTLTLIIIQLATLFVTVGLWLLAGYGLSLELPHLGLRESLNIYQHTLETNSLLGAMLYAVWILIHYVYLMATGNEEESSETLRQKLLISTIELKTVKATVHPHFMYNSLNMLANLSLVQPEKIHDYCVNIADFLRYSVNYSKKEFVSINDEITHIKNYLAIEKERFGDRLEFELLVDENCKPEITIPLLLFPLIENSIKHGIDSSTEKGKIKIVINKVINDIKITVQNSYDAQGVKAKSTGIGLASLKKRITNTYKKTGNVLIEKNDHYFKVTLLLPSLCSTYSKELQT